MKGIVKNGVDAEKKRKIRKCVDFMEKQQISALQEEALPDG